MMSSETREHAFAVLAKRLDELLNISGDVAFVLLMRASSTCTRWRLSTVHKVRRSDQDRA